ncbi:MAG: AAA-like domain-containing protein [Bacteroidia bacterium]
MEKVLKKYTTIPQHLYVNRNADIQLKRIIEEMQRPGYVLVARQMGKTNLLINAKRTLENKSRLFAYVDLSNLYTNERDCYRNIINCIIEPNLSAFYLIQSEIEKIREKELPPHNEYSRSLVSILNNFKGDLVVILDEIDALKSIEYSDNIFAQIRSNYFSRTNYPVLERLTYVLSGVIEPTELIKDKNKSPFNIGDKIYLDDFTKEEYNTFIQKSELPITNEISEEIFKWTNGNPRLTFDVCSDLENEIIENREITINEIKSIITRKYLTSFDIAPIDHIRELVKSSRDIRRAIVNIYSKNLNIINDDIKRKLYLYGIIGSNFNGDIYIKNKIIEQSLSLDWIKSIEKVKEITLVSGLATYSEKYYLEALEIFEEIISTSKHEKDIEASSYFAGMCSMKLKNYEKALGYFSFEFKDTTYIYDSLAYSGVCQIVTDNLAIGFAKLEGVIQNETNSHAYHTALLNLSINEKDKDKALSLLERLYDSTFKSNNPNEEELSQLRALSSFYQAEIFDKRKEIETAISKINNALENCKIGDSLFLSYYKNLLLDTEDKIVKSELVDKIINNKLRFEEGDSYPISFTANHIYFYLSWVYDDSDTELFEKLLDYTKDYLIPSKNRNDIALAASRISENKQKYILAHILNSENEIEEHLLLDIYRDYIFLRASTSTDFSDLFYKYLQVFEKQKNITVNDVYIFAYAIKYNSDKRKIEEAIHLCDAINAKLKNVDDQDLIFEALIIYYWYSNLYFSQRSNEKAIEYADITLGLIKGLNGKNMSMIDEAGLKSIREQMLQIKSSSIYKKPLIIEKRNGRNDKVKVRYQDGNTIVKKYKQVEADILAGRCHILETLS